LDLIDRRTGAAERPGLRQGHYLMWWGGVGYGDLNRCILHPTYLPTYLHTYTLRRRALAFVSVLPLSRLSPTRRTGNETTD
jgi:hypothetical protein